MDPGSRGEPHETVILCCAILTTSDLFYVTDISLAYFLQAFVSAVSISFTTIPIVVMANRVVSAHNSAFLHL